MENYFANFVNIASNNVKLAICAEFNYSYESIAKDLEESFANTFYNFIYHLLEYNYDLYCLVLNEVPNKNLRNIYDFDDYCNFIDFYTEENLEFEHIENKFVLFTADTTYTSLYLLCSRWNLEVSGTKINLINRLQNTYNNNFELFLHDLTENDLDNISNKLLYFEILPNYIDLFNNYPNQKFLSKIYSEYYFNKELLKLIVQDESKENESIIIDSNNEQKINDIDVYEDHKNYIIKKS